VKASVFPILLVIVSSLKMCYKTLFSVIFNVTVLCSETAGYRAAVVMKHRL
jgi:hypothetical protein